MKEVARVWIPDHDQYLGPLLERDGGVYQYAKQKRCYDLLRDRRSQFRLGVDVGAHVGLWSKNMSKIFAEVVAFEPLEDHRECFVLNVPDGNVVLYACALGEKNMTKVKMLRRIGSSLKSFVLPNDVPSGVAVLLRTLDSFKLRNVDFIKIDCEGYEYFVVNGGEQTIKENKPVIMVEQKIHGPRYGVTMKAAVELLQSWGAKIQFEIRDDYCLAW